MSYPPPPLFDHPAIYKTSWRAGERIALVYNYVKTHTRKHVFIVCCITALIFGSL